jgi:hypothetical protein
MHEEGDEAPAYSFEAWSVLNESVKGYLLASRSPKLDLLRVGDILGIQVTTSGGMDCKISVAVIRWVRKGVEGATEVGAEIVPGNPHAVRCQSIEEPPAFPDCPAIFFPALPVLGIRPSLLAAKDVYAKGRRITVIAKEKSTSVQANASVMETACLDRFDFTATSE